MPTGRWGTASADWPNGDGYLRLAAAHPRAALAARKYDRLPSRSRARTQLLLGQLQRRHRLKEAATISLSDALRAFDQMGTPLWAKRARDELARTKASPTGQLGLTASEQRVVELAASCIV